MRLSSAATSDVISVLIADSNRMQSQLLTSALRRHSEFHITPCYMDTVSIFQAVAVKLPRIALLSLSAPADIPGTITTLRRFHLSYPEIPKILLVDTCNRELVVSAFRSGARGIFPVTDASLRMLCKCLLRVAAGQIWASTEHLNYILDLISEVPSLRVLDSRGTTPAHPARGTSCCSGGRRTRQPRDRRRAQPQRAHDQEISLPHLRKARDFHAR